MTTVPSGVWPIDPNVTTGTDLANYLNTWMDAFQSMQASATRPPLITKGGVWAKTIGAADIALMFYDGTADHEIGSVKGGSVSFGGGVSASATAPTPATLGDTWVDTTIAGAPVLKVYNGTAWVAAGGGVSASAAAPTVPTPVSGDLWVDISAAGAPVLKIWDGTAWGASGPATTSTAPTSPTVGQTWMDTSAVPTLKVWSGTSWVDSSKSPSLFTKEDASEVAWAKTGNGTAETQTAIYAEVNGLVLTVASGTSITMPSLVAGTDYAIWLKVDGGLAATTDHTNPPAASARKIGGFHYAAGGNATAQSGGNTTAQINEYSFWDLNFRPACPDPRGMALVGGSFWVDIYLTGVDAITNGSSKYNVTIADGFSPPKTPTMFGGDGSATYVNYTWFDAQELAMAFGKRCLTQLEFMSAMYGTTEGSGLGSDPAKTKWDAAYVSKWGINQATGCQWAWGRDRGGPAASATYNANTDGRGSEAYAPNAALFGGYHYSGADAGSRCSSWGSPASASVGSYGSRFVSDHLKIG